MRLIAVLVALLVFFSCKKTNDTANKLTRKEATTYTGTLLITEYVYDSQGRIVAIKQSENNAPTAVAVTVSYNGNGITLISHPQYDPAYTITKEVHLTLDAGGKLLKKIGQSYLVSTSTASSARFKFDTLECVYDAAGFLKETKRGFYDSTWAGPGITMADRASYRDTFTTAAGNLTKLDRYTVFNRVFTNTSGTIISGGSTENHTSFNYINLYPNKTDL